MRYHRKGMVVEAFNTLWPFEMWPEWADGIKAKVEKNGFPITLDFNKDCKPAHSGDWIVYEDDGEYYPYKDQDFKFFYRRMNDGQ